MKDCLATDGTRREHGWRRGLVAASLMLVLAGCAVSRPKFIEREYDPVSGLLVKERELSLPTLTGWPATTTIEKQKASLGKTFSFGQTGYEAETSNTNAAATLRELRLLLESVR